LTFEWLKIAQVTFKVTQGHHSCDHSDSALHCTTSERLIGLVVDVT